MKIEIMHNMCGCPGNVNVFQYKKMLCLSAGNYTELFFISFSISLENFLSLKSLKRRFTPVQLCFLSPINRNTLLIEKISNQRVL